MMFKPNINNLNKSEEMISLFGGYDKNYKIPENSFNDESNMTSDYFPVLSPRNKRILFNVSGERLSGLFAKASLGYINNGVLYYNGKAVTGLSFPDINKNRQFISMGAKLLIFPDKVYLNTNNLEDFGSLEAEFETSNGSEVTFTLCKSDGALYENYIVSSAPPESPKNNDLWLDTSVSPNELKQYSEYNEDWSVIATTYVKISFRGIGADFKQYDGVKISGCIDENFNGAFIIQDCADDYIIVSGILNNTIKQTEPIKIERKIPDIDFFCENSNRIWGCSSKTNEIFSSKLGDPTNWQCYMGIASDSYAVSVGTDGDFTGAVSYKGYVLFFKENCVHKIFGSIPPFTVNTGFIRGVQKGSEKSLVSVNETLYYKSPNGIVMYDGGLPISISDNFALENYSNAVAGSLKNKYYVCMTDKNNKRWLFTYDENKSLWHKEDEINICEFVCHNCNLYFIAKEDENNKRLYLADGVNKYGNFAGELAGYYEEDDFNWFVETGLWGLSLPEKKYYSNINIRAIAKSNSEVKIYFQYNSSGEWVKKADIKINKNGSHNIPFVTPRCDHLKMRIEGKGDVKILSISRKTEKGSEK